MSVRLAPISALVFALLAWPTLALAAGGPSGGRITVADQDTPVIDQAQVLDPATRDKLIDLLHQLKLHTGAQVKVLTVPSLGDEDIFTFSQRHFQLWKLGQKGKDNGALIVLAPTEHKEWIDVGYGLEGVLPDIWCGRAERQVAQQYFKQGQFSQGMLALVQQIVRRISDDANAPIAGLPKEPLPLPPESSVDGTTVLVVLFLLGMVGVVIFNMIQQRQQRRWGGQRSGFGRNYFPYLPGGIFTAGPRDDSGGWGGGGGGWSSGGGDFGGGGSSGGGGAGASW